MASVGVPKIVSEKKFRAEVEKLRKKEKKNSRERDKISAERRKLPMMEMKNNYIFQTDKGPQSFLDLFEGRRQLIVYHFMYHPKTDTFCKGCSFVGDHIPHLAHINARNTSFAMISHAPLKSIQKHKKRMGWDQPWHSAINTNFNEDLGIDGNREHALSVFFRDKNKIYRSYYTVARGVEYLGTPFAMLDLTPWGRQELWEKSPKGWPQTEMYTWWNFHDKYK